MLFMGLAGRVVGVNNQKGGVEVIAIKLLKRFKTSEWGIYFSLIKTRNCIYPAITHIGSLSTFGLVKPSCHSHILNFKGNLLNQDVELRLLVKLRDVKELPSFRYLAKEIKKEIKKAKIFFGL